jgi:hypothetical protein
MHIQTRQAISHVHAKHLAAEKLRSSVYSRFRNQVTQEERRSKRMDKYDVQLQRINDIGPTKFLRQDYRMMYDEL